MTIELKRNILFLTFILYLSITLHYQIFPQPSYCITVKPKIIGSNTIDVEVTSNIKEDVRVSVSLALDGQKPDYILMNRFYLFYTKKR